MPGFDWKWGGDDTGEGITDIVKRGIREEAAKGPTAAVKPWLVLAIGLSLYALYRTTKRRRR